MKVEKLDDKNFEHHNLLVKFIRIFSVPLLNYLPSFFIKKIMVVSSRDSRIAVKYGGSTHALEGMYGRYERKLFSRGFFQGIADLFWHHCLSQPKAVRNRLKIVGMSLMEEIVNTDIQDKEKNITILTIAGGSTRAIIQSFYNLKKRINCKIKIINIDKSEKALNLSKEIARKFNLYENFEWINEDARNIKSLIPKNSIDVVEMVGLLDYFSEEKSINVISQIYDSLKVGGLFIVGNICPNKEELFIHKIGWPQMYYRNPADLSKILELSGFDIKKGKIIFEPLKCHIIAVIKK
ncbi:MAG: methyltransferase domain-containing protein [Candidatus Nealsonbacteria bacterium]